LIILGDEIRIDLVRVLQNRLNDGVLELLTTMLYRNPQCRLYPDDVRFVQPSNGHPDYTMKVIILHYIINVNSIYSIILIVS